LEGNGLVIDSATPLQISCSVFCMMIQAPIITSMVVSISARRRRLRSASSMTAPTSAPSTMASRRAAKKSKPRRITSAYMQ
jgi:hypothetical protein